MINDCNVRYYRLSKPLVSPIIVMLNITDNITDCPNHQYCHQLINIRQSLQNYEEDWKTFIEDSKLSSFIRKIPNHLHQKKNYDEDWKTFIEDLKLSSFIRKIPNHLHQNHFSKLAQTTFALELSISGGKVIRPLTPQEMQKMELFKLN